MEAITTFLIQFKIYFIVAALALYPVVWLVGDFHGRAKMQALDLEAIVKQDQKQAIDNKKAANAAIGQEDKLSDDLHQLDDQKNEPIPQEPTTTPCKLDDKQLQYLQGLINQASGS